MSHAVRIAFIRIWVMNDRGMERDATVPKSREIAGVLRCEMLRRGRCGLVEPATVTWMSALQPGASGTPMPRSGPRGQRAGVEYGGCLQIVPEFYWRNLTIARFSTSCLSCR